MTRNCRMAILSVLLAGIVVLATTWSTKDDSDSEPQAGPNPYVTEREYPFGAVPDDARRRAWQASQTLTAPLAEPSLVWQSIGPMPTICASNCTFGRTGFEFPTSGRVNTIAVSPENPQLVLIGAGTGGIWRSEDGGSTFVPVSGDHPDLTVGSIAFSASRPSIVYAGMGDPYSPGGNVYFGGGVLKSTNAGRSWVQLESATFPAVARVAKLIVDPADSNRLYAVVRAIRTGNQSAFGGFYFSTDGGATWSRTFETTGIDLALSSADSRVLYLGGARGLERSTDGGLRWQHILDAPGPIPGGGVRVATAASDLHRVYAAVKDTAGFRVLVSRDGGTTWTQKPTPPLEFYTKTDFPAYLAVDPTNADVVYAGCEELWKSTDGAETWINVTRAVGAANPSGPGPHVDSRGIAFAPTTPQTIYFADDGGLQKSTDGGRRFETLNRTLSLVQFYTMVVHPDDSSLVMGGTQDNGVQRRVSNSMEWEIINRGDVGQVAIDTVDSSYVYFAGNFGFGLRRYRNRGLTFDRNLTQAIADPIVQMPSLATSSTGALYLGTWRLWGSTNRGDTMSPLSGDLTKGNSGGDAIKVIAVSKVDPRTLYTGSFQGRVMASTNAGVGWTDVTGTLPNRTITSIVPDTTAAASAFLTVSGFGAGHVFWTTNSGATWTDISGNLPDIPVNALLIAPDDGRTLYVGTDIGVFRSTTGGTVWTPFNTGLPAAAIVTGFAAQRGAPIRLATYGRGAYELQNPSPASARQSPIRPPR